MTKNIMMSPSSFDKDLDWHHPIRQDRVTEAKKQRLAISRREHVLV